MDELELGQFIQESSVRNKDCAVTDIFSVTNSDGFILSTDYFNKEVYSKNIGNYKLVYKNQFAYNPSRINVGSIDFLRRNSPVAISPLYVVFKCNKELYGEYLKRFLKSPLGNIRIRANTQGAVRDSLAFKHLSKIRIPVLPITQQICIAIILNKAEELISQRKKSVQLLDEFLMSTFLGMFGEPVGNKKNWEVRALSEILTGIQAGWSPVCEDFPRKNENQLAILKLSSVTYGHFDPHANKRLKPNTEIKRRIEPNKNDLLFSRKNTFELVGATAYVFKNYPNLLLSDTIFKLNYDKAKVNGIFLWKLLSSKSSRDELKKLATGSAGSMPNISQERLLSHKTILPPLKLQTKFADIVEKTEALKAQYQVSLQDLENLYGSLSQKAFKGELNLKGEELAMAAEPMGKYSRK